MISETIQIDPLRGKSLDYISKAHNEEFCEAFENLLKKQFTISQIEVEHRSILHWEKEGLLSSDNNLKGTWRKFSFVDLIWIKLIIEMRAFGISIQNLKKIKSTFFHDAKTQLVSQTSKEEFENSKKILLTNPNLSEEQINTIKNLTIESIENVQFHLSRFDIIVFETLYSLAQTYILIHKDGETRIVILNELSKEEKINLLFREFETNNSLNINLTKIINVFFENENINTNTRFELSPISKQERQIIEIIRDRTVKEIKISLKDGKEIQLKISRIKPINDAILMVQNSILKNDFIEINIITEKDKGVVFINEIQKKRI